MQRLTEKEIQLAKDSVKSHSIKYAVSKAICDAQIKKIKDTRKEVT